MSILRRHDTKYPAPHLRRYGLYSAMALLAMFATMDSVCSVSYEDAPRPEVRCDAPYRSEGNGCGRLCAAGFWSIATADDVRAELDSGASVKKTDADGYSPLHLAAECSGDSDLIALLLDAGADENRKGPKSTRPLHLAAGYADGESVRLLIEAGADIEARTWKLERTPLHFAVFGDNSEAVRILLEQGADLQAEDGPLHRTPVDWAWRVHASLETVEILIDFGASVEPDDEGITSPLHVAAISEAPPEVIMLLVSRGAPINATNWNGETPLRTAYRYRSAILTREVLWALSRPINEKDSRGWTLLHLAVDRAPHPPIVRYVLEQGADPNLQDLDGRTPLHLIATRARSVVPNDEPAPPIIDLLLEYGAELEVADQEGRRPLHWAARLGNRSAIVALLEHGASVSAQTNAGETPCDLAAEIRDQTQREDALAALGCRDQR